MYGKKILWELRRHRRWGHTEWWKVIVCDMNKNMWMRRYSNCGSGSKWDEETGENMCLKHTQIWNMNEEVR